VDKAKKYFSYLNVTKNLKIEDEKKQSLDTIKPHHTEQGVKYLGNSCFKNDH
jgi:hypothetical protein